MSAHLGVHLGASRQPSGKNPRRLSSDQRPLAGNEVANPNVPTGEY